MKMCFTKLDTKITPDGGFCRSEVDDLVTTIMVTRKEHRDHKKSGGLSCL